MGKLKKHYHWLIAAVVLMQLLITGGIYNSISPLFLVPVTQEMEIPRATFSLAYSMKGLVAFFSTFLSGAILTRFGYRRSVVFFMSTSAVAVAIMATAKDAVMFGLGAAIMGMADGVCMNAGPARIVRSWFHRYQGTVLGAVSAATGIGGSLLCILLSAVIEGSGWRAALLCCTAMVGVMAVVMLLVIRDRPQQKGLRPYGEGQYDHKKTGKVPAKQWDGFDMKQLLRRPTMYILMAITLLSCMLAYTMQVVLVPHLRQSGLTAAQATGLQSAMMLMLATAKLCMGFVSDKLGAKWSAIMCLTAITLGLVFLASARSFAVALAGVICLGFALAHTTMTVPLLVPDLFGTRAQAMGVGVFMSMVSLASMLAGPVINAVYDAVGSYRPVYRVGAAAMVVIIGLYCLLFWLAGRDKKRAMAK